MENVKTGKHKIKLPLGTCRKQGPIPVLEIILETSKLLIVDIKYQQDIMGNNTGMITCLDVYGNKIDLPMTSIKYMVEVCATMIRKKGKTQFLRHPMKVNWLRASFAEGSEWVSKKEMTSVVNSKHASFDYNNCYWYENSFSI